MTDSPFQLPRGFRYAGVTGGIKASGKPDVAFIVSDRECVAAAVTTTNQVFAAPVELCREISPLSSCRGVVINSGNANACTGTQGIQDAKAMRAAAAKHLNCAPHDIFVMSTGVIGHHLPMEKVLAGIELASNDLGADLAHFTAAADAICTTDQFRKVASVSVTIGQHSYTIAAMCKGAGMIAPNMATMLGVVVTDAPLSQQQVVESLKSIVDASFNQASVDGHTSTNDTVVLMSSGNPSQQTELSNQELALFTAAATDACVELAKKLVADGEGAVRFFEVEVAGASSPEDASAIARCVAASPLVKTAITGGDPNWGRIVSAAGYAGPKIEIDHTSLAINGCPVFENGTPVAFDDAKLSEQMKGSEEVKLLLHVGSGNGRAKFWSSDLTEHYVRFNSLYTT